MRLVGTPLAQDSAREHVSGEALYLDDLPAARNELLVYFVGSPLTHARIKSVDVTAAPRCAAAEVLIDRFTGDVKVTRADILMDNEEVLCRLAC